MFKEFEPLKLLSSEQLTKYLDRIECSGSTFPSKEKLDELVWQHQLHIPFETLDCHDFKIGVDLDPDAIFNKVIDCKRGGHCLELNKIFCRLLLSLGFNARPCMSRVLKGTDDFTHPIDHRTTLVLIEDKYYYCDVGFGGPMPSRGLEVHCDDWQDMHGEEFKVEQSPFFGWYFVCRKTPNGNHTAKDGVSFRYETMFTLTRCFERDFVFENKFISFDPEGRHVANRIVNMRTENGYKSILNNTFTETNGGQITEYAIKDDLGRILREQFGINVELLT